MQRKGTQSIRTSSISSRNKNYQLSYPAESFIKIVTNYFDLPPFMTERIHFKLKVLYRDRIINTKFENAIRALLLLEASLSGLPRFEHLEIFRFVNRLYKPEDRQRQILNIYSCLQIIEEIFQLTEQKEQ
jgi:hypothetical protein